MVPWDQAEFTSRWPINPPRHLHVKAGGYVIEADYPRHSVGILRGESRDALTGGLCPRGFWENQAHVVGGGSFFCTQLRIWVK